MPKRHGTGGAVIVPYQLFDTADRPVCLAPGNDRLWARCAQVLGHPEWATDPRYAKSAARVHNKAELLPLIAAAMVAKHAPDWLEAFEKAGVPQPGQRYRRVANTPQLAAADLVHELPGGGPKVVGLSISFDRKRPRSARRRRYWAAYG